MCLAAAWRDPNDWHTFNSRVYGSPRCLQLQYTSKHPLQSAESLEERLRTSVSAPQKEQGRLKQAAKPLHLKQHNIEGTMHAHTHGWQAAILSICTHSTTVDMLDI